MALFTKVLFSVGLLKGDREGLEHHSNGVEGFQTSQTWD